ncbi:MAG: SIMPL domain-containing protein [Chromatiales bacterium]|nr:SIMPL domain-containing protein [Chromatiales bacterium]
MSNGDKGGLFFAGLFVACGMMVAGFFVSQTIYNAKVALNTAEAKGLAERRVTSDRANWEVRYTVTGTSRAELPKLYQQAEQQQQTIAALLAEVGFDRSEITLGVLDYSNEEFRNEEQKLVDERHMLSGSVEVDTDKVALVATARSQVNKLMAQGIDLVNRAPKYRFTRLNEIKPEMLREATKNARIAATEFAENAGVNVGGIRDARQGGFIVRDAGEEYGDTEKVEKEVRVVTTITFYLTE